MNTQQVEAPLVQGCCSPSEIRKLLEADDKYLTIFDVKIFPHLVQCLKKQDTQSDSLYCITKLTCLLQNALAVVNAGIITLMIDLLSSTDVSISQQAIETVANIMTVVSEEELFEFDLAEIELAIEAGELDPSSSIPHFKSQFADMLGNWSNIIKDLLQVIIKVQKIRLKELDELSCIKKDNPSQFTIRQKWLNNSARALAKICHIDIVQPEFNHDIFELIVEGATMLTNTSLDIDNQTLSYGCTVFCEISGDFFEEIELANAKTESLVKYNSLGNLTRCLTFDDETIRWYALFAFGDLAFSNAQQAEIVLQAGILDALKNHGYLEIKPSAYIRWKAMYCDDVRDRIKQNAFIKQSCWVLGNIVTRGTQKHIDQLIESKIMPTLINLSNQGLPSNKGANTYTIDSNYGVKDKKFELITLTDNQTRLLTHGLIRRHLNQLKRFNVSPNDISTIVFKYLQNDFDRYFLIRNAAVNVISDVIDCTSNPQVCDYLVGENVIPALCCLLTQFSRVKEQTLEVTLSALLRILEWGQLDEQGVQRTDGNKYLHEVEPRAAAQVSLSI